ncbi:maleylpyruvate isomerase N-terminal domain-containing protein [Frankia sp. R82]|uniref:maleylpyruvate isomerase N-terminal domain-containing protein n=1 Tax=Frankia sp. R82 TaxID=2950553 RepID=UPI002042C452|nr:maleylpyruvate isomerase N-terminal domain-containing protein [Frankia sp. R82]MCM3882052.1 maleylpyruvate isomerase N-terminal domain-containing protein [Frankia sp. R82]
MAVAGAQALGRSVAEAVEVFATLRDDEWTIPSACPGWTLHTVLAHLTLGIAGISGLLTPEPPPPGLEFEAATDVQARALAARPPAELLGLLRKAGPAAAALFGALPPALAARQITMGTAGTYPFAHFADALTFDATCHLRWDILAPRGPLQRSLPDVDAGRLSAAVRWLAGGIPQMTTQAFRDLLTDPLTIVITGPEPMTIRISPHARLAEVTPGAAERGQTPVVDDLAADDRSPTAGDRNPARATVRSSAEAFILWATGREPHRDRTELLGDATYATWALAEFRVY